MTILCGQHHVVHGQVGDPQQLPATVLSSLASEANLAQSLFERLQRVHHSSKLRLAYACYSCTPFAPHIPFITVVNNHNQKILGINSYGGAKLTAGEC